MRSRLERSINMCFSKIKLRSTTVKRLTTNSSSFDPTRPLPTTEDLGRPLPATATPTNLVKNFNSLYDDLAFDSTSSSSSPTSAPDLSAAFASQRFFFASPGLSNSIVESSSSSSLSSSSFAASDKILGGGGVAVQTFSQDPFEDFRRSMQEMVEARRLVDVRADWDRLHELLACYLSLNPKSAHKFILRAFSDLLVSMMAPPTKNGCLGSAGKVRLL